MASKSNPSLDKIRKLVNDINAIYSGFKITGGGVSGNIRDGFQLKCPESPEPSVSGMAGGGGITLPTGACCRDDVCTVETQASCESDGGVYQGDGTPCDPNPCFDACSITWNVDVNITRSGTCDTGISVSITTPATFSGSLIFNELISVDEAVVCLVGFVADGSEGTETCGEASISTGCNFTLALGYVTSGGLIYGTFYPTGTYVLFIPGFEVVGAAIGDCELCTTHIDPTAHAVVPGITNTINLSENGFTTTFSLTFEVL